MKKADHQQIQHLLDGDLGQADFKSLQERMRGDPELYRLYEQYALLHHALSEEFEGGYPVTDASPPVPGRAVRLRLFLVGGLAAALVVMGWWIRPWFSAEARPDVAVASFSVDAVWNFEGPTRKLGGATGLAPGTSLDLRFGRAEVVIEPAVSMVMEGPARVSFQSAASLHVEHGRAYFVRGGAGSGLTVTTPLLKATDFGTEFGLEAPADGPHELHVTHGRVKVTNHGGNAAEMLAAGDAVRVSQDGALQRVTADGRLFATGLGRFHPVVDGPIDRSAWRVEYGNPELAPARVDGTNYAAFLDLGEPQPNGNDSVLLATLVTSKPSSGDFHTDGWAGISFFSGGNEILFFGDSFGTKPTWSLDVKQRIPVILPARPVVGPATITMRYDLRTGAVSLHEGTLPLRPPFCEGRVPAGTRFDRIRLGASAGASLSVASLNLRAGGGS